VRNAFWVKTENWQGSFEQYTRAAIQEAVFLLYHYHHGMTSEQRAVMRGMLTKARLLDHPAFLCGSMKRDMRRKWLRTVRTVRAMCCGDHDDRVRSRFFEDH
jgi:hypothetical protein